MLNELGRASVPLLTIISGWLFMAARPRPYRAFVGTKVRSLLMPMVVWNAIMVAVGVGYALVAGKTKYAMTNGLDLMNAVFAVSAQPLDRPVGFLRDLFVVFLLSPVLLWAVRRFGIGVVLATGIFSLFLPNALVILRTPILFYFSVGMVVKRNDLWRPRQVPLAIAAAIALGTFSLAMIRLSHGEPAGGLLGDAMPARLALAYLFWSLSVGLASTRAVGGFAYLEQFAFLAFCSHFLLFRVLAPLVGKPLFGDVMSPWFPVYFTAQPFLGYLGAILIALALRRLPAALALLNAGKLPRPGRPPQPLTPSVLPT